jgi:hypothetical protein
MVYEYLPITVSDLRPTHTFLCPYGVPDLRLSHPIRLKSDPLVLANADPCGDEAEEPVYGTQAACRYLTAPLQDCEGQERN